MPNVNLTAGAGAGLPLDLAAQLQKQVMLQQLAESLISAGMERTPATIQGPSGNPYARSTPNLEPLGQLIQQYQGRKMLGESQDAQIGLANAAQQRALNERSDILRALTGTNSDMGPGIGKPGSAQDAMNVGAAFPQNQALQNSLLEALVKAKMSAADKAQDPAWLRNVTPQSYAAGRGTEPMFGLPNLDPNKLEGIPQVVQNASGNVGLQKKVPGAPLENTGAISTTPAQINEDLTRRTGAPTVTEPGSGKPTVVEGPTQKVGTQIAENRFKEAGNDKDTIQSFKEAIPQYVSLAKLAKSAYEKGTFGPNADIFNSIRKWGAALGINPDPEGKITDFETYIKDAVPLATAKAKEGVGARVAVVEFQSFLQSLGATGSTDPRAVMNIIQGRLLSGANHAQIYKNTILPGLKSLPGYGDYSESLDLPFNFATEILRPLAQANIPFNWKTPDTGAGATMGGEAGTLSNEQVATPGLPASNYLPGKKPIKFGDLK